MSDAFPLAHHVLTALAAAESDVDLTRLEELLAGRLREAQQRWPGIRLETEAFLSHLAERARSAKAEPLAALEKLAVSDLYLACACARHDPAALAALEECLAPANRALAQMGMTATEIDEVRQTLRRRMLTGEGPGQRPAIAQFGGRSPLSAWLKVAAVRAAVDLRRRGGREVSLEEKALEKLPSSPADPELAYLKARYREQVTAALKSAIASLSARELLLLRQHYVDGLTPAELGTQYRVHRTTVGRWLDDVRQKLHDAARRVLEQELRVGSSECESLMRMVRSQMSLTLSSFLPPPRTRKK